ncbi:MAG: type II toxin-antitoxin system VapC family toxin [Candidatus Saccharimonas sp.]|nr:type II toxin-antitoxin system VapC family toxin [Planctomycetaceae bacterium]
MMVFVDTWAWVALALKRDQHHDAAKVQHQTFRQERRRYVTSDFVLNELITQLYPLLPSPQAQSFIGAILTAGDAGEYAIVHVTPPQFRRAWELRQKYHDKPGISFVDFTSIVIMQEMGLTDVFTGDAHFREVNLGFQLFP